MKTVKTMAVALVVGVMGGLGADAEAQGGKVYRAVHPYWWDAGRYTCEESRGAVLCNAGAWMIPKLSNVGENSIAAIGDIIAANGRGALMITTTFTRGHDTLTLHCAGEELEASVHSRRKRSGYPESWAYVAEMDEEKLEECLARPLTMRVDGRAYRLGTKRLRRAREKAQEYME